MAAMKDFAIRTLTNFDGHLSKRDQFKVFKVAVALRKAEGLFLDGKVDLPEPQKTDLYDEIADAISELSR